MNPKQPKVKVRLERSSVLPVVQSLLLLLLKANFSCHADMFLLAAKVYLLGVVLQFISNTFVNMVIDVQN